MPVCVGSHVRSWLCWRVKPPFLCVSAVVASGVPPRPSLWSWRVLLISRSQHLASRGLGPSLAEEWLGASAFSSQSAFCLSPGLLFNQCLQRLLVYLQLK